MDPETFCTVIGLGSFSVGTAFGILLACVMSDSKTRELRNQAFTEAENLYLKGKARDLRDTTSASPARR
jgi:hypothetical protein